MCHVSIFPTVTHNPWSRHVPTQIGNTGVLRESDWCNWSVPPCSVVIGDVAPVFCEGPRLKLDSLRCILYIHSHSYDTCPIWTNSSICSICRKCIVRCSICVLLKCICRKSTVGSDTSPSTVCTWMTGPFSAAMRVAPTLLGSITINQRRKPQKTRNLADVGSIVYESMIAFACCQTKRIQSKSNFT